MWLQHVLRPVCFMHTIVVLTYWPFALLVLAKELSLLMFFLNATTHFNRWQNRGLPSGVTVYDGVLGTILATQNRCSGNCQKINEEHNKETCCSAA